MSEHPIESLMVTAMNSLRDMIDVNTIIGDVVESEDGTIIIPVSKVSFGFMSGGSEFNTNKLNKYSESVKLPFGGGSGAGVNISPSAFLVVKDGNVKILNLTACSPLEKVIDQMPDVINKACSTIENMKNADETGENDIKKSEKNLRYIKKKIDKNSIIE